MVPGIKYLNKSKYVSTFDSNCLWLQINSSTISKSIEIRVSFFQYVDIREIDSNDSKDVEVLMNFWRRPPSKNFL